MQILMIEATNSAYQLPDKGIVGNHAIFDPACLETPLIDDAFKAQYSEELWQIMVKRHDQISCITYPFNRLEAIGWHGDLAPVRINWRDIRPLMSHRYHLPPSAHTTFVAHLFVVCIFVSRTIESDAESLKVSFYHNNDDYDEVMLFLDGYVFNRDNIDRIMVILHPDAFTHGQRTRAFQAGMEYR